jgi:cellulose synthase/poly-beta-1,6-N-acetylglucosamine synthase-like glycosyltransferase
MNDKLAVTIAFVFRERLSSTVSCLQHLLDTTTPGSYELICVDAGAPESIAASLRHLASRHGFTLVRSEEYLSPNQSRNLALQRVRTRYVVFVDNDVTVGQDWLNPLVRCAEETGAWLVGPLYLESHKGELKIHMFGGRIQIRDEEGRPAYIEKHNLQHVIAGGQSPLVRQTTDLVEFHTLLMNMDAYQALGPLDEKLWNIAEHADLCLAVKNAGKQIYLEPSSVITYLIPDRLNVIDREYFALRWSESWTQATLERLAEKYLIPLQERGLIDYGIWARFHRQRALVTYPRLRGLLGPRWHQRFRKYVGQPLEKRQNLRRYNVPEEVRKHQAQGKVVSA